ncbi:MAG: 23S rRNA (guanosine(2251)-2'-O)-methyltransferase RlmB [Bacteroidales bacterium]|jgi:23S rRNA (guanosine2251-2'-O)-methyltransferase|nr:23S rRNA (guanosine(2251)-2'-O)-methyltransferase RlmB [Bacteroidales bacterium]
MGIRPALYQEKYYLCIIKQNYKVIMRDDNIIYGIRPIMEAIDSGINLDKVLMQSYSNGFLMQELKIKLKENGIRIQFVPIERLDRITPNNHQGVIALVSTISYTDLNDALGKLSERNEPALILVLDKITDVRNFGAITRTAVAAGVDFVIVPSQGAAAIGSDAIKTSAGGLLKVPIVRVDNLKTLIHTLHQENIMTICADEKATESYTSIDCTQSLAIILGSEDKGIERELIRLTKKRVSIPIKGDIGSLNVSVAAGILMYEVIRQRNT